MDQLPNCPKCNSPYTYEDNFLLVCPECGHEWQIETINDEAAMIKDCNGNILNDGDTITIIKDLKVKGSSSSIKVGTKVKNIRLVNEPSDGHDIECRITGFGAMKLKSEFVKKVA